MKKIMLVVIAFFIPVLWSKVSAQKQGQARIDSLLTDLSSAKQDTNKVKLLNEIGTAYYSINPNEGIKYGNKQLALAEKLKWNYGIAKANNILGVQYWAKSDYPKALEYYFIALKISEELNDKELLALTLGNIGIIYFQQANYPKALEYDSKAVKMFEELGNKKAQARNLGNIGEVYSLQGNYSKALEYYFKALKMKEESGGTKEKQAVTIYDIGSVYRQQADYSKALEYYFKAIRIDEALGEKNNLASSLSGVGSTYLAIAKNNNTIHLNKLFADNRKAALEQAKIYTDSAIIIFKEIQKLDPLSLAYQTLSDIQELLGKHKDALTSYKNYTSIKDSVFNREKDKKLTQALMQYEFDKKEEAINEEQVRKDAVANRTRNLQYVAIGAFLLLGLILLYGISQKQKAKTKIERAYIDLKSTQAQLIQSEKMASLGELTAGIAHEIQNPLNFVNNFSEVNTELIDEAGQEIDKGNIEEVKIILNDIKDNEQKINHHGKRADAIVKGMLQHSRSNTGVKELTDINALCDEYLRLSYHGLRAKDKSFNTDFKTEFDNSIGKINIIPQDIGRVLLNLYNNAFYATNEKQKIANENYKPIVSVQTKKIKDKIEIRVSDNGNGIPQKVLEKIFQPFFTTKPTGQGTGLGLSLSYDIVKAHGGELKVETKEGAETTFIIQIPSI